MSEAQDRINALIQELGPDARAVGTADESTIARIETALGLTLPVSYRWFLHQYGTLMLPNYILYGAGSSDEPACLKLTLGVREKGLPPTLVVVENDNDGGILCLDLSQMKEGECPVVRWAIADGSLSILFADFYELLIAKLNDTKLGKQ